MNIKKIIYNLLIVFLLFQIVPLYGKNNNEQNIEIEKIHSTRLSPVLDEWKFPGRYSPLNAFDGNKKTCYAVNREKFVFTITFKKRIIFDEIRIAAGLFANEKYYKFNNRVKEIKVKFYRLNKGTDPFRYSENVFYNKSYLLEDKKEYQSMKIGRDYDGNYYYVKYLSFYCKSTYKGAKYNDTCVSDIRFFYKGKEISIVNITGRKKKYIRDINLNLRNILSNKKYRLADSAGYIKTEKNGRILRASFETPSKFTESFYGVTHWDVRNSRLYFKFNGKWELVKYVMRGSDYEVKSLSIHRIGRKNFEHFLNPISIGSKY